MDRQQEQGMSEMIERVVKTLRDIDLTVGTPNYYQVARAIIESMREPTEAMRQAARQVWKDHEAKRIEITGGNGSLPHPDWELHYYHAMIDEALK